MKKISRRKFTKKATLAVAAGALAVNASTVIPESKESAKHPVVLYRETKEWKKYYETLK